MIGLDALADKRVILVGGVSGSGKSVFAAALAAALPGHDLIKLDWIYNGLHRARTRGGVARSRRAMAKLAPAIVAEIVTDIVADSGRVIIEGGWIEPSAWRRIAADNPALYALFMGYPDAGVAALIARLGSTAHWLSGTSVDHSFLADQVRHSKRLRRKLVGQAGMEFIDASVGFVAPFEDDRS